MEKSYTRNAGWSCPMSWKIFLLQTFSTSCEDYRFCIWIVALKYCLCYRVKGSAGVMHQNLPYLILQTLASGCDSLPHVLSVLLSWTSPPPHSSLISVFLTNSSWFPRSVSVTLAGCVSITCLPLIFFLCSVCAICFVIKPKTAMWVAEVSTAQFIGNKMTRKLRWQS